MFQYGKSYRWIQLLVLGFALLNGIAIVLRGITLKKQVESQFFLPIACAYTVALLAIAIATIKSGIALNSYFVATIKKDESPMRYWVAVGTNLAGVLIAIYIIFHII